MLVFLIFSIAGLKLYQQQQSAPTSNQTGAAASAASSSASSGAAPPNGNPASPTPAVMTVVSQSGDDDDSDDGAMTATVLSTTSSQGAEPEVMSNQGSYDANETQATSGADNPVSDVYRRRGQGRGGRQNSTMDRIWSEVLDLTYISSQPGIVFGFQPPGVQRQDWNPSLNNQPWAHDDSFQLTDPTALFDTDAGGIPNESNDTEDC